MKISLYLDAAEVHAIQCTRRHPARIEVEIPNDVLLERIQEGESYRAGLVEIDFPAIHRKGRNQRQLLPPVHQLYSLHIGRRGALLLFREPENPFDPDDPGAGLLAACQEESRNE